MEGGFEYQSLARSTREIRLLELFPRSHELSKTQPTCRVFTRSLDANPPFLALSYVWGDANDTRVILVDRRPFHVTRNLYDALISIAEDDESLIVWIDAICINQADDEEKGWQVEMMGDIYKQASSVLAWLGPAAGNSDSVIDHLQVVGKQAEECGLHIDINSTVHAWNAIARTSPHVSNSDRIVLKHVLDGNTILVTVRDLEKVLNPMKETVDQNVLFMTDLTNLFRRSWWGRIWCLQEITLPETAYFTCGSKRISRRRLLASYYAYRYLCYVAIQEAFQQRLSIRSSFQVDFSISFQVYTMLRTASTYRTAGLPLIALLRHACAGRESYNNSSTTNFKSTDPRDKVFALLGIAKDQEELQKLGFSSDYRISTRKVYMKTTIALLQQGYSLVFSWCRASPMPSYLPSWVPDWSQPMVSTLQNIKGVKCLPRPRFSASEAKGLRLSVNFSKNKADIEGISVLGNTYDLISIVGDVPRFGNARACRLHDWLIEILRLSYEIQKPYSDYSERLRAVVRTSHADWYYSEYNSIERRGDEMFLRALYILLEETTNTMPPDIAKPLQEYLARGDVRRMLENLNEDESPKIDYQFTGKTIGRCPFVTTRGYLGLGCLDTRQGDVVALIGGAQVPFILRPERNGNFTIVSEAYVDGIMDGEAVETGEWRMINLV